MNKAFRLSLICIAVIASAGCEELFEDDESMDADPVPRDYSALFTPLPSEGIYPDDNPYSIEKERLGEMLFWDPILSGDQQVACASCHHPEHGWADGRQVSMGVGGFGLGPDRVGGLETPIHSPTIMNTGFAGMMVDSGADFVAGPHFWDLRAETLEEQALGPIKNSIEMKGENFTMEGVMEVIMQRLYAIDEYQMMFEDAFGPGPPITPENIAKAIATFVRGINSPGSRFDAFLEGDSTALTEREIVGLNKFIDGGCADCHNGPMLSDNQIDEEKKILDDLKAVRTPSLRNIALTPPYFQDGSRRTLGDAVGTYEDRGDLGVSAGEGDIGDITAFLETLTAQVYSNIPERVPSGLPVGGDIN